MLRDSIERSLDQQIIDEKDDNDLLIHIFATMSLESHLSLETHSSYPAFRASLPTQKNFTCWALLTLIHSTGNASNFVWRSLRICLL